MGDDSIDTKLMRLYIESKSVGDVEDEVKHTKKEPIPDIALLSDHNVNNDDIIILEMDDA